jgi:hypothetical protein
MSNLRINIRIFIWHLKVHDNWRISWSYNPYHKNLEYGWFDICEWRPLRKF